MTPVETVSDTIQTQPQVQPQAQSSSEPPQSPATPEPTADPTVEVHEAELREVAPQAVKAPAGQIDILLDTAVPVSATLGSAEVLVRDVLQWGPGSVLKLDRHTGEPVDLYLRGVKFATGHIVVVGDQLGVRIKEVLSGGPATGEA